MPILLKPPEPETSPDSVSVSPGLVVVSIWPPTPFRVNALAKLSPLASDWKIAPLEMATAPVPTELDVRPLALFACSVPADSVVPPE